MRSSPDARFRSVLLVEDDDAHALLVSRVLRAHAGTVVRARSVAEARASATSGVDLVVSDLALPDGTPATTVASLLSVFDVPLVVLSSSTSLRDAVDAMKAGARDYIPKQFDADFAQSVGIALARIARLAELEREGQRLTRETEALRAAAEHGRDGFAVVTAEGRVVYRNGSFAAAARRCGGDPSDLLSLFTAGRGADAARAGETVAGALRDTAVGGALTLELPAAAGRENAYELNLSVIRDDAGTGRAAVAWIRDVTDAKRRERFQRDILSATTHDLKGPLGAVMLSAELLKERVGDDPTAAPLVNRIAASAHGAVTLIDEFLSARRIEEGAYVLKPRPADVAELVASVVEEFGPVAASRGIGLTADVTPRIPPWKLDKLGAARVLGNLVSNAVKYTPRGGAVLVSARPDAGTLRCTVKDDGSGMEPAEARRIFEPYARLDRHSGVAGTGLGLFVVKSIVAAHGGTVEVVTRVGDGTAFTVTFPEEPPVDARGETIALNFA